MLPLRYDKDNNYRIYLFLKIVPAPSQRPTKDGLAFEKTFEVVVK